MRGTVRRLEYGRNIDDSDMEEEDINPNLLQNLALAQAKFNWLMQNAR
jgi:hypothetical protein